MTSPDSIDVREVIFINERCRVDYEALPADVRESADQAIDALQNGRPLSIKMYQPLHGVLSGIHEIRLPYDDNMHRVYVTLKCPWIIMALDAGSRSRQTERTFRSGRLSVSKHATKGRGNIGRSMNLR